jgi:hypothetical protein
LAFVSIRLEVDGSVRKGRPCGGGCFQTVGKIVRHGRLMFLKISAAILAAFATIRERCARIMREGGAVPETS